MFASLDNLGAVSGDSSAEMTVEKDDQTALETSVEVPAAQAQEPVQEAVAGPSTPQEPATGEANGHAETNGHAPAAEPAAGQAPSEPAADQAPSEPADASADLPAAPSITPDVEKPAFGPRILGVAEPVKPLPSKKAAAPARKRRRRPSAAERHRRAFFAALTDLRRGGSGESTPEPDDPRATVATDEAPQPEAAVEQAAPDAPQPEAAVEPTLPEAAVEPMQPEAAAEPEAAPQPEAVAAEPEAVQPETPAEPVAAPAGSDESATSPARLTAAIERVGGPEVIKEALKPKQDEKGQPLKWAAVCAQSAEGLKPGDPVFNAWVRLAATPVREVKGHLPRPAEQARPAGGGRDAGRRSGGQRPGEAGGRRDRGRRDDRPSRQEYASHAHDGKLRTSIRIVTGHDEDQERRERERVRKEQREAKRRAERERLARLGY